MTSTHTRRANVTNWLNSRTQNRNRATATVCERRGPPTIYDLRGHIVHAINAEKTMSQYFCFLYFYVSCYHVEKLVTYKFV